MCVCVCVCVSVCVFTLTRVRSQHSSQCTCQHCTDAAGLWYTSCQRNTPRYETTRVDTDKTGICSVQFSSRTQSPTPQAHPHHTTDARVPHTQARVHMLHARTPPTHCTHTSHTRTHHADEALGRLLLVLLVADLRLERLDHFLQRRRRDATTDATSDAAAARLWRPTCNTHVPSSSLFHRHNTTPRGSPERVQSEATLVVPGTERATIPVQGSKEHPVDLFSKQGNENLLVLVIREGKFEPHRGGGVGGRTIGA